MRTINTRSAYLLLFTAFFATVFSCKKDATSVNVSSNTVSQVSSNTQIQTLDLRPGPKDGQDVYVEWMSGNDAYANSNFNYVAELPAAAWTFNGTPLKERFYLRFDSLAKIPRNAKVISATLYLYGLSSSLNMVQGNSSYAGSPYPLPNICSVSAVQDKTIWNESTLTWNTQPAYTTYGAVQFGPSTSQWNWDVQADVSYMVAAMVKFPAFNGGFRIALATEAKYRGVVFGSSEAADVNDRPRLVVKYNM